jgi:hypothetical protein
MYLAVDDRRSIFSTISVEDIPHTRRNYCCREIRISCHMMGMAYEHDHMMRDDDGNVHCHVYENARVHVYDNFCDDGDAGDHVDGNVCDYDSAYAYMFWKILVFEFQISRNVCTIVRRYTYFTFP